MSEPAQTLVTLVDFPGVPAGEVLVLNGDRGYVGTTHPEFWMDHSAVVESTMNFADSAAVELAAKTVLTYDGKDILVLMPDGSLAPNEVALVVYSGLLQKSQAKLDEVTGALLDEAAGALTASAEILKK